MLGRISGRGQTIFPKPASPALGNQLPAVTGAPLESYRPGPGGTALGSGGQLGTGKHIGVDPRVGRIQPRPVFMPGESPLNSDTGVAGNRESFWRGGIQGFNDQLTVKDRHAYWDTGNQKTGLEGFYPAGSPNAYNDPVENPPRPDLRTVNRTVSYQKGSDATRNQDDLTRGYTWLGEQGSGWTRVNGGVHGLYQPYGTRGGIPYAIASPVEYGSAKDGPGLVWGGPPHGLHSQYPVEGRRAVHRPHDGYPADPPGQDRPPVQQSPGRPVLLADGASARVRPSRAQAGRGRCQGAGQRAGYRHGPRVGRTDRG